jgi:SAM-dependent methyltransferase
LKISSSPISSPDLFDNELRITRLNRYCEKPDFLAQHTNSSIIDRLSFVKRKFPHVLTMGSCSADLMQNVQALGHGEQGVKNLGHFSDETILSFDSSALCSAESKDFVLSNLNLNWVNDLPGMLIQIRKILKPDGMFIGAFLGGDTLWELKSAFLQAEMQLYGGASPRVAPMIDLYSASQLLLRADFKLPVADRDTIRVEYSNLSVLMQDLRLMGLTNVMRDRHKFMSSRRLFKLVEEVYMESHALAENRISATFEIIYLTGWAYHEEQQKALPRGSARNSLKLTLETS